MRLYDYKFSPVSDRRKWMETVKISSGLGYFGGKQFIGKYLMASGLESDGLFGSFGLLGSGSCG